MIRWKQVAEAWYGIEVEYGIRTNKSRVDNRPFEVFVLVKGHSLDTLRVIAAYSSLQTAEWKRKELDDQARAESVIRLLKTRSERS